MPQHGELRLPGIRTCRGPGRGRGAVREGDCSLHHIGIAISANRHPGIRCALCADTLTARLTRLHNDANMLALGGGIVGENLALEIVNVFLNTPFSGEARHQRRIDLIEKADK